jgi:hypothetical protein
LFTDAHLARPVRHRPARARPRWPDLPVSRRRPEPASPTATSRIHGLRQRPAGRGARDPQPGPDRHGRGQRALVAARLRAYLVDHPDQATPRNLFGFKDGTANLKAEETDLLREQLWVQPGTGRTG